MAVDFAKGEVFFFSKNILTRLKNLQFRNIESVIVLTMFEKIYVFLFDNDSVFMIKNGA